MDLAEPRLERGVTTRSTSRIFGTMPSVCAERLRPVAAALSARISAGAQPASAPRHGGVKTLELRLAPSRARARPSQRRRPSQSPIGTSTQASAPPTRSSRAISSNVRASRKVGAVASSGLAATIQPARHPSIPSASGRRRGIVADPVAAPIAGR